MGEILNHCFFFIGLRNAIPEYIKKEGNTLEGLARLLDKELNHWDSRFCSWIFIYSKYYSKSKAYGRN